MNANCIYLIDVYKALLHLLSCWSALSALQVSWRIKKHWNKGPSLIIPLLHGFCLSQYHECMCRTLSHQNTHKVGSRFCPSHLQCIANEVIAGWIFHRSITCFWAAFVCGWTRVKIPSILAGPPGLPSSGVWNLKCPTPRPGISLMTCPITHQCCSWCCWGCWCAGWVGITFSYNIIALFFADDCLRRHVSTLRLYIGQ